MTASRSEKLLFQIPPAGELMLRLASHCYGKARKPGGRTPAAAIQAATPAPVPAGEIRKFLEDSGVEPESVIMVHSDSRAIEQIGWTPPALLDFLQSLTGHGGTLMMPSHAALRKVGEIEVYDPKRSPSTVGLLTELFRRRPGVLRSLYPLSPVAAFGALAGEMVEDHGRSYAPHDEKSPYYKMVVQGAKVVCVGVPLDRMTLIHAAEDVLRDEIAIPNFYEKRTIGVQAQGEIASMTVHARAAWLWWYLAKYRWSREIVRRGFVTGVKWNGVAVRVTDARGVFDWMAGEVRRGRTIYPLASLNSWFRLGDPKINERM